MTTSEQAIKEWMDSHDGLRINVAEQPRNSSPIMQRGVHILETAGDRAFIGGTSIQYSKFTMDFSSGSFLRIFDDLSFLIFRVVF